MELKLKIAATFCTAVRLSKKSSQKFSEENLSKTKKNNRIIQILKIRFSLNNRETWFSVEISVSADFLNPFGNKMWDHTAAFWQNLNHF